MGTPSFGYQRPKLRLMDTELHLDPDIEAQIRVLQMEIASGRVRQLLLKPDFSQFAQSHLNWVLRQPPPTPRKPLVPAGAGPSTPKPAELGDLGKAVWGVPAVKQGVTRLGDSLTRDFRLGWGRAGAGEKAAIISTGVVIAGGSLAGALLNPDSRLQLLTFADGKNIPIPGVDGLSFRLMRRGSGVSGLGVTAPLGLPGLSIKGNFNAGEGTRWIKDSKYDVFLTWDVMEFLRRRRR
jgi:hypothetical protein